MAGRSRPFYDQAVTGMPLRSAGTLSAQAAAPAQDVRYAHTADGVRIAFATSGVGAPLVKTPSWCGHLDFDWRSPVWRHWLDRLGADRQLVRYDERGSGLSEWDVHEFSLDSWVTDLETVVDNLELDTFDLLGTSHGGAISIAYAARHPERVRRLIFFGAYAEGSGVGAQSGEHEMLQVLVDLARVGWGKSNPTFRQVFTDMFFPTATDEIARWWNELQRISTNPENAVRFLRAFAALDVTELASQVTAPSLVLHCRDDKVVPLGAGQKLAKLIPRAEFVELPGRNHILLTTDAGWEPFLSSVRAFLSEEDEPQRTPERSTALSAREGEVLSLVAEGLSNTEIAERMVLSPRTVERHLSNIYAKLGVSGKAARAAAAAHAVRTAAR